ncbi:hypothetical protein MTO96_015203 [Rhipicephalus appendiculatus]
MLATRVVQPQYTGRRRWDPRYRFLPVFFYVTGLPHERTATCAIRSCPESNCIGNGRLSFFVCIGQHSSPSASFARGFFMAIRLPIIVREVFVRKEGARFFLFARHFGRSRRRCIALRYVRGPAGGRISVFARGNEPPYNAR